MALTVKAAADLAGVSVRTLHHYDEIGLLRPAAVSQAGYRLYAAADLERLQQILFFRELDFSLQEIKAILDDAAFDRRAALQQHRRLLVERQQRLARLILSVDRTIEALERGVSMNEQAMFDGFDVAKLEQYREEAAAVWGKEAADDFYRRAANYTSEDFEKALAENQERMETFAALMDRDPADPEVQRHIGIHYRTIERDFFAMTPQGYRELGNIFNRRPAGDGAARPGADGTGRLHGGGHARLCRRDGRRCCGPIVGR